MNDKDDQQDTAILIASREGKTDVVDFLIKNGANLNERDTIGYTPLMLATEEGHTDTAKLLKKLVEEYGLIKYLIKSKLDKLMGYYNDLSSNT